MSPFASDSCHTSIRGPGCTGYIRGFVRSKEKHNSSDLFRLCGSAQGNGTQQGLAFLVVLHEIFRDRCISETWDNSIDPDSQAGIIIRHDSRQAIDACLARTICRVTRSGAEKACRRRGTDHASTPRSKQRANTMLTGQENACEVNCDGPVPYLLCEFVSTGILTNRFNPRLLHHYIQSAPACNRLVDSTRHLVLVGNIGNQWHSFASRSRNL